MNSEKFPHEKRKHLSERLKQTLQAEIAPLSTDMQQILCDDLVTALQNRLIVLKRADTEPE